MKTLCQKIFAFLVVVFFLSLTIHPVLAHGDEPRVEISAERLNPGAVLDLRGVDFERDAEVTLMLIGGETEISFGSVLADTEGIFQLSITLPADLPEGTYTVHATSTDHIVNSPPFVVAGTAQLEGGEQRELEEPLLAPMPTGPANVPTNVPAAASDLPKQASSTTLIWIASGIAIVLVLLFALRLKR